MRLIDAEKLKAHYSWWKDATGEMTMGEAKDIFDEIVDLQPTAEKHGHWIKNEDRHGWHCSKCKEDNYYAYSWSSENGKYEFQDNYCPHCGARMDDVEVC